MIYYSIKDVRISKMGFVSCKSYYKHIKIKIINIVKLGYSIKIHDIKSKYNIEDNEIRLYIKNLKMILR